MATLQRILLKKGNISGKFVEKKKKGNLKSNIFF